MAQSQVLNAGGRSNPNIEEQSFDSNATENEPQMSVDEEKSCFRGDGCPDCGDSYSRSIPGSH